MQTPVKVGNERELARFRLLLEQVTEEYLSRFEQISKAKRKDEVPVSIFTDKLSPLETVVKYLRENVDFSLKEISEKIRRSQKTVWQAYNSSKIKLPPKFVAISSEYNIPVKLFANRALSILEIVASYLRGHYGLRYHDIAVLLKRNERTVWTVCSRARKKNGK